MQSIFSITNQRNGMEKQLERFQFGILEKQKQFLIDEKKKTNASFGQTIRTALQLLMDQKGS